MSGKTLIRTEPLCSRVYSGRAARLRGVFDDRNSDGGGGGGAAAYDGDDDTAAAAAAAAEYDDGHELP